MKTLIIVDVQYDFLPGGNLAVKDGDQIIPIINGIIPNYDLIIFTQDFHPANHKSFASQHEGKNVFETINLNGIEQVLWPDHCIQGSRGCHIHDDLIGNPVLKDKKVYIFKKGMNPEYDSYSGFADANSESTGLSEFLWQFNDNEIEETDIWKDDSIKEIDIVGLALDYCVFYTAKDAFMNGYKPNVILEATIAIQPDWSLDHLKNNGINWYKEVF